MFLISRNAITYPVAWATNLGLILVPVFLISFSCNPSQKSSLYFKDVSQIHPHLSYSQQPSPGHNCSQLFLNPHSLLAEPSTLPPLPWILSPFKIEVCHRIYLWWNEWINKPFSVYLRIKSRFLARTHRASVNDFNFAPKCPYLIHQTGSLGLQVSLVSSVAFLPFSLELALLIH